jgi:hypothetical protein
MSPFEKLPVELLLTILGPVDLERLHRVRLVSRHFNKLVKPYIESRQKKAVTMIKTIMKSTRTDWEKVAELWKEAQAGEVIALALFLHQGAFQCLQRGKFINIPTMKAIANSHSMWVQ